MIWRSATPFEAYEEALVRACYQVLLGREPEPAARALQTARPIGAEEQARFENVLRRFIESEEYSARQRDIPAAPHDALAAPLLPIEQLTRGMRTEAEDKIRALCRTTSLGNDTVLCRILGHFHFFAHTSDIGFATHVMHSGLWEMPLTEFIARTIKPRMRVLDVGANYGYYSVLMADLVQDHGFCHAFEPNPKVAQLLKRSLYVNGFESRSRVWELALSNADDESVHFFVPHGEPKNGHLIAAVDETRLDEGYFTEVAIRSMDGLASELGRIDFIKIDAEGAEFQIVEGMRDIIRAQKPIMVVEVNCARYDATPMLQEFIDVYGAIHFIGDDGHSHPTSIEEIRTVNVGTDWLVHLDPKNAAAE
jgi:FkbM family methyltransferase